MSRRTKIEQIVSEYTEKMIHENRIDGSGMDALYAAQIAKIDRSNASRELNQLWREGALLKLQGHPVQYLSRKVLLENYNCDSLPDTLLKGEKLSSLLSGTTKKTQNIQLDRMIGADGSLHDALRDAKAAVTYPPYGLSMLLEGNPGVDKLRIAMGLQEYAIISGAKPASSRFIRVECSGYAADEKADQFLHDLFGDAQHKGYLTSCGHGIVYLNGIQNLSTQAAAAVADLIDRGSYTRPGETSVQQLTCTVIGSISPSANKDKLFLRKSFPLVIPIMDIEDRGIYEKTEVILDLFEKEAVSIQHTIRISKDILFLFMEMKYPENIPQMRAEVKQTCARAFLASDENMSTIIVSYPHLSLPMLEMRTSLSYNAAAQSVLSLIDTDYIVFDSNGTCTTLQILKDLPSKLDVVRFDQFLDRLDIDAASMNDVKDFITENISTIVNCGNAQLVRLQKTVNPLLRQVVHNCLEKTDYEALGQDNPRLLLGLLTHMTNVLEQLQDGKGADKVSQADWPQTMYPDAYKIAQKITSDLEHLFHITLPPFEIHFIAMYLTIAEKWDEKAHVPLLLVMHGESIASQLCTMLSSVFGNELHISAIDYKETMQMNDLLELVHLRCNELDHGQGILLIVDGEPLNTLADYAVSSLHIRCRSLRMECYEDLLNICHQIISGRQLDQIVFAFAGSNGATASASKYEEPKDQSIVYRLTHEFLQPSLTFLNADKAVDALMISLSNILEQIHRPYSNEIATKFLCHAVNMLERVIRVEPLPYPKVTSFIRAHTNVYRIVEKNLQNLNELYGIVIPKEELAYITEIFLDYMQEE